MPRRRKETNENGIGHNSDGLEPNSIGMVDATALKSYVERAARIMEEQKELGEALKEICGEADEAGVASKREIRRLARESLMDHAVMHLQLDRMDMLRAALGGFATTPLGEAAVESARQ